MMRLVALMPIGEGSHVRLGRSIRYASDTREHARRDKRSMRTVEKGKPPYSSAAGDFRPTFASPPGPRKLTLS